MRFDALCRASLPVCSCVGIPNMHITATPKQGEPERPQAHTRSFCLYAHTPIVHILRAVLLIRTAHVSKCELRVAIPNVAGATAARVSPALPSGTARA